MPRAIIAVRWVRGYSVKFYDPNPGNAAKRLRQDFAQKYAAKKVRNRLTTYVASGEPTSGTPWGSTAGRSCCDSPSRYAAGGAKKAWQVARIPADPTPTRARPVAGKEPLVFRVAAGEAAWIGAATIVAVTRDADAGFVHAKSVKWSSNRLGARQITNAASAGRRCA